ncbi:unnamed protein product, partial [Meganyctiphanes norvegica]
HQFTSVQTKFTAAWTVRGIGTTDQDCVLGSMCPERALCGKTFPADVAVEGSVLHAFKLSIMVPQMLLKVRQLYECPSTFRDVAFIWPLTGVQSCVLLYMI